MTEPTEPTPLLMHNTNLRYQFAAAALTGILANPNNSGLFVENAVEDAFHYADLMTLEAQASAPV